MRISSRSTPLIKLDESSRTAKELGELRELRELGELRELREMGELGEDSQKLGNYQLPISN